MIVSAIIDSEAVGLETDTGWNSTPGFGNVTAMQIRMNISADAIDDIPLWHPPEGYVLRRLDQRDEELLPQLLVDAAPEWAESPFDARTMREYLDHPERRHGSYVIEHGRELVASCFATRCPDFGPGWGILDYVCVQASHRKKALGFGVCASVLRFFRESGYKSVTLTTLDVSESNHRLAAIKLYLKLGLSPVRTDDNAAVCEKIYRQIGWPLPVRWWEGTTPP